MNLRTVIAVTVVAVVSPGVSQAQDSTDQLAVPGICYTISFPKKDSRRLIDRIELQEVQVRTTSGQNVGPPRINLGIQPRGGDNLIPNDVSAPCTGTGGKLTCSLLCNDSDPLAKSNGRFRVEPSGKSGVKLTLDTPIKLNACSQTDEPVSLPASLVGKSFTLRRSGASDCFH